MQDKTINPSLQMLLDIGRKMILDKGCRGTTLQDIADEAGLTKGAIYHYVKSKDELFAMILEAGMEQTNRRFFESVSGAVAGQGEDLSPVRMLSERLHGLTAEDNAAGLIFIYLLSQKGKPGIEAILKRLNEASLERSKTWIEVGQKHRVIPEHVDAEKMAKLLNVFKNGLQVQSILSSDADDLSMSDIFMLLVGALGAKNLSD